MGVHAHLSLQVPAEARIGSPGTGGVTGVHEPDANPGNQTQVFCKIMLLITEPPLQTHVIFVLYTKNFTLIAFHGNSLHIAAYACRDTQFMVHVDRRQVR